MRCYLPLLAALCLCSAGCDAKLDDPAGQASGATPDPAVETARLDSALQVLNARLASEGVSTPLLYDKYTTLVGLERFDEALATFDLILDREGLDPDIVADKIRLLTRLKRFDEALATSLEADAASEGRSPWIAFGAMQIHVATGDVPQALDWLEKAAERGLKSFDYLQGPDFAALQKSPRFEPAMERMRRNAGIGSPAPAFSAPLFTGGHYALDRDRGKVVLLDFWATWCPPCIAEHPRLAELYARYRASGLEIVGVNVDSDSAAVARYLRRFDIPWINVCSGDGRADATAALFGVDSFPYYVLIDRSSTVRYASDSAGERLAEAIAATLEAEGDGR